jgi:hypothetical protein
VWLPDLAWAAGVKHFQAAGPATTAAAGGGKAGGAAAAAEAATEAAAEGKAEGTAALEAAAGVSAGEVTWRRLHAMGPSALLQQQMELGLLASLSTTQ